MIKKVLKSFSGVILMMFMAGIFCLIPSFIDNFKRENEKVGEEYLSNSITNANDSNSIQIERISTASVTDTWENVIIQNENVSFSTENHFGMTVSVVDTAEKLAKIAYQTNTGKNTGGIFYLSKDIDLGAKLWTPIGTSLKPFNGTFFGNGHTIKNIRIINETVDTSASSGVGLFGNIKGAQIVDTVVGGSISFNVSVHTAGSLIGVSDANSYIINCHDDTSYPKSIGNTTGKYFKGLTTDFTTDNKKIGLKGIAEAGNAYIYNIQGNAGNFYKTNNDTMTKWGAEDKRIRVIKKLQGSNSNDVIAGLYVDSTPTTRNNAALSGTNGLIVAFLEGAQVNISATPDPKGSKCCLEVTFNTSARKTFHFNYHYGNRTDVLVSVPYDIQIGRFKKSNQHIFERLGWVLTTVEQTRNSKLLYEDFATTTTESVGNYKTAFFDYNKNNVDLYFSTPGPRPNESEEKNRYVVTLSFFGEVKTDSRIGNSFVNAIENVLIAGVNVTSSISENSVAGSFKPELKSDNDQEIAPLVITITLKRGYEINTSSTGKNFETSQEFTVATGTGENYNTVNKNSDSYLPVTKNFIRKHKEKYEARTYEIKYNNIASNISGSIETIKIPIVRQVYPVTVDIVPTYEVKQDLKLSYYYYNEINMGDQGFNKPGSSTMKEITLKISKKYSFKFDDIRFGDVVVFLVSFNIDTEDTGFYHIRDNFENISANDRIDDSIDSYIINRKMSDINTTLETKKIGNSEYYKNKQIAFKNNKMGKRLNSDLSPIELIVGPLEAHVQGVYGYVTRKNGNEIAQFTELTREQLAQSKYKYLSISVNGVNINSGLHSDLTNKAMVPIYPEKSITVKISEDKNVNSKLNKYVTLETSYLYNFYDVSFQGSIWNNNDKKKSDNFKSAFDPENSDAEKRGQYYLFFELKDRSFNVKKGEDITMDFSLNGYNNTNDLLKGYSDNKGNPSKIGIIKQFFNIEFKDSLGGNIETFYPNEEIYIYVQLKSNDKSYYAKQSLYIGEDIFAFKTYKVIGDVISKDDPQLNAYVALDTQKTNKENGLVVLKYKTGTSDLDLSGYALTYTFKVMNLTLNEYVYDLQPVYKEQVLDNPKKTAIVYYAYQDSGKIVTAIDDSKDTIKNGVTLDNGYYLLGWYLKNGHVTSALLNENYTTYGIGDNTLIEYSKLTGSNTREFNISLVASIGTRQVTVTHSAGELIKIGEAAYGQFYCQDGPTSSNYSKVEKNNLDVLTETPTKKYTFSDVVSLRNDKWRNAGNKLVKWIIYDAQGNKLVEISPNEHNVMPGSFDLKDEAYVDMWNKIFKLVNKEGTQYKPVGDVQIDKQTMTSTSITIKAVWDLKDYQVKIDANHNISPETAAYTNKINIGTEITFASRNTKNGVGDYKFTHKVDGSYNYIGSSDIQSGVKDGYIANIFSIYKAKAASQAELNGALKVMSNNYVLDIDNFMRLMGFGDDVNKDVFDNETDIIYLNTLRDPATYKITIKLSGGYSIEKAPTATKNVFVGVENGEQKVYVIATFDSPVPELQNAHIAENLIIKRDGYTRSGWDKEDFNPDNVFKFLTDFEIEPTWARNDQLISADIDFTNDVVAHASKDSSGKYQFYSLNAHNILQGSFNYKSSKNYVNEEFYLETPNAERVVDHYFQIVGDGKILYDSTDDTKFNLKFLNEAKNYKIKFVIFIKDKYDTTSKTKSDRQSVVYSYKKEIVSPEFVLLKNTLVFDNANKVTSVYSGTSQFWPTTAEEGYEADVLHQFGGVYFKNQWYYNETEGNVRTEADKGTSILVSDFFITANTTDMIISGSTAVGKRDLQFKLKGFAGDINGYTATAKTNWYNLINVAQADNQTFVAEKLVNVVRALFIIDFGDSSSYYFENDTIVYQNDSTISFNVGVKSFTYNYKDISYNGPSDPGTYIGGQHNYFVVNDLAINGHIYNTNQEGVKDKFRYTFKGTFTLADTSAAQKINYIPKYLIAKDGALLTDLVSSYHSHTDVLAIENIYVKGSLLTNSTIGVLGKLESRYCTYRVNIEGNQIVLFSYNGNNTTDLKIFFNNDLLSQYEVKFTLSVKVSEERQQNLSMLTISDSLKAADYANILNERDYEHTLFDHKITITSEGNQQLNNQYVVISDVHRINLSYNTGFEKGDSSKTEQKVLYISGDQEALRLASPVHAYQNAGLGIKFTGYAFVANGQQITTTTDVQILGNLNEGFKVDATKGGASVNIWATWKLESLIASQLKTQLTYLAQAYENKKIDLSELVSITDLANGTFVYTLTKKDGTAVAFDADAKQFILQDKNGKLANSLKGDYVLNVELTDNNPLTPSKIDKDFDIHIDVNKNEIGITRDDVHLGYLNKDLHDDTVIVLTENGKPQDKTLTALQDEGVTKFGIDIAVIGGFQESDTTIHNAGSYTITITVNSAYTEFYKIASGKNKVTLTVDKFEVVLSQEEISSQINLSKVFGSDDPALTTDISINNEEITLLFERQQGEAIGKYPLLLPTPPLQCIQTALSQNNYSIDTNKDFDIKFAITVPQTELEVKLLGNITHTYNGKALDNLYITYDAKGQKYIFNAQAGSEKHTFEVELYYSLSNGQKVSIPVSERNKYATEYIKLSLILPTAPLNAKDVGIYSVMVSRKQAAIDDGWIGIKFVNGNNPSDLSIAKNLMEIVKRDITVQSATMVFNQTDSFIYNNNDAEKSTATVEITNIVGSETVEVTGTIASPKAGDQDVDISSLALDSISDGNYTLIWDPSVKMVVTPSHELVKATITSKTFDYGTFRKDVTLEKVLKQIPITFVIDNAEQTPIDKQYIFVTGFAIHRVGGEANHVGDAVDATAYSSGLYLKQGNWVFVFTVESINYVLGNAEDVKGTNYDTKYNVDVKLNRINLTILNSVETIRKEYDGNNKVLDIFVNQNADIDKGYYVSEGKMDGDTITIISGTYSDREYSEELKDITLAYGGDYDNYVITTVVKGYIDAVTLTFVKNVDTFPGGFVADGLQVHHTESFDVSFVGDVDALIQAVHEKYATRTGYTQVGWNFEVSIEISLASTPDIKEQFLQGAVDAQTEGGFNIYSIWEINTYTLKILQPQGHCTMTSDKEFGKTYTLNYFDSYKDVTFSIEPGYILDRVDKKVVLAGQYAELEDETAIIEHNIVSTVNVDKRQGNSFSFDKIFGNIELTIVTREIEVKIAIDMNEPTDPKIFTGEFVDNEQWTKATVDWAKKYIVMKYSDMFAKDLPVVQLTEAHTYHFDGWLLGDAESGAPSTEATIWEKINGDTFVENNVESGFVFTATWYEDDLNIVINSPHVPLITMTQEGRTTNGVEEIYPVDTVGDENTYVVKYNHKIEIKFESDAWYKITGILKKSLLTMEEREKIEGSQKDNQTINFTIYEALNIEVSAEEIVLTFDTRYTCPEGTEITEQILKTQFKHSEMLDKTFADIGQYTPKAGTYTHDAWNYIIDEGKDTEKTERIEWTQGIEKFITGHGDETNSGVPHEDMTFVIEAIFLGDEYTINFNPTQGHWETAVDKDIKTMTFRYGDILTGLPEPVYEGFTFSVWSIEGEQNGDMFAKQGDPLHLTTPKPVSHTLTFLANWTQDEYKVQIIYDKDNQLNNHIKNISVNHNNNYNQDIDFEIAYYENHVDFKFTLDKGYELDMTKCVVQDLNELDPQAIPEKVVKDNDSDGNAVNILKVTKIHNHVVVKIAVKAKDYKIVVETNQYVSISRADGNKTLVYDVSFDQNIQTIFNQTTFTRQGYEIAFLKDKNTDKAFASFAVSNEGVSVTLLPEFTYVNLYKTDRDLVLYAEWRTTKDYFTGVTTGTEDKYFNANSQEVASTVWNTEEKIAVGETLKNGDKIVDLYYQFNGSKITENVQDFKLYYRNAVDSNAYMVVVLEDQINKAKPQYSLNAQEDKVIINKSQIQVSNAIIQTYYSATEVVYPSNKDYTIGQFAYPDTASTVISELMCEKVEIVDKPDAGYIVGDGYSVKYFFVSANKSFDVANYTDLTPEGKYFTYVPSNVKAKIVHSIIDITVGGKAFENQSVHQLEKAYIKQELKEYNQQFKLNITSITTKDVVAGLYGSLDNLDIVWDITLSEVSKKDNFKLNIMGNFEIIASTDGYRLNIEPRYFDAQTVQEFKENVPTITVTSFNYLNAGVEKVDKDKPFNFIDSEGNLVFSISSNNTSKPDIQIRKGCSVEFKYQVSGIMGVLTYIDETVTNDAVRTTLEELTKEEERYHQTLMENDQSKIVYVVLSDYKAIFLDLGDKLDANGQHCDQGYTYIKLGSQEVSVELTEESKWTGFDFIYWTSQDLNIGCQDGALISVNSTKITRTQVVAKWDIQALDTGMGHEETIARDAKIEKNAILDDKNAINFKDVVTTGIINKNDYLTYKYTWELVKFDTTENNPLDSNIVYEFEDGFKVHANTNSNGTYRLTVEASYNPGYTKQVKVFDFALNITKLDIGNIDINKTEFTYANYNYVQDIDFTFTEHTEIGKKPLGEILNKLDTLTYAFTINEDEKQVLIQDKGKYTLTLIVDETVFNSVVYTQVINISAYNLVITKDLNAVPDELTHKLFGTVDPNLENKDQFTFDWQVPFSGEPTLKETFEVITMVMEREPGETVGSYRFTSIGAVTDKDKSNYIISFGELFTFSIRPSENILNITIKDDLSTIYNGKEPVLTIEHDADSGYWMIYANKEGSNFESKSQINLTFSEKAHPEKEFSLTPELYAIAMQGITMTALPDNVVANKYTEASFQVNFDSTSNFTEESLSMNLEIKARKINIVQTEKVFDRNDLITPSTVIAFSNVVEGDNISMTGKFASNLVGDEIALKNLVLTGERSSSYEIANRDFLGKITTLKVENAGMGFVKQEFVYGELYQSLSLDQLKVLSVGQNLSLDGSVDDLKNNFVSIESWNVDGQYLSSSSRLKAGSYTINVVIKSTNMVFKQPDDVVYESTLSIPVSVQITKLGLNLTALTIEKNYDSTTKLALQDNEDPFDDNKYSIDMFGVLKHPDTATYPNVVDDIDIDLLNSHYISPDPVKDSAGKTQFMEVIIELVGNDVDNYYIYSVGANGLEDRKIYGKITPLSVFLDVVGDKEGEGFVTDNAFVLDSEEINIEKSAFRFESPVKDLTGAQIVNEILKKPTRTGYTAVGWKYEVSEGKFELVTSENILSIIENVVLDQTNVGKRINIYTVWEIQYREVSAKGKLGNTDNDPVEKFEITANENDKKDIGGKTVFKYYSNVKVKITAKRGYKLTETYTITDNAFAGTTPVVQGVGTSTGSIDIEKIKTDLVLTVVLSEIQVNFNINVTMPDYSERIDKEDTAISLSYPSLNKLYKDTLFKYKLTEGTYNLIDFTYETDAIKNVGEQNLQLVVDAIIDENLTQDCEVSFTTVWQGCDYVITFDANGGVFGDGKSTKDVNVRYNEEFTAPVATKPGQTCHWMTSTWNKEDIEYSVTEPMIFKSVGVNNKLTIKSTWSNNTYTLTVKFGEHIESVSLVDSSSITGLPVENNSTKEMIFNETTLKFIIKTDKGYDFIVDDTLLSCLNKAEDLVTHQKIVNLKNIISDSTIEFKATPAPNKLGLTFANIENYEVVINNKPLGDIGSNDPDNDVIISGNEKSKDIEGILTESEVYITVTAKKGYEFFTDEEGNFTMDSIIMSQNSSGIVTILPETTKGILKIKWAGFNCDSRIGLATTESTNKITFKNLDRFTSIYINEEFITGTTYNVKTNTPITVVATLKYGYDSATVTSSIEEFVASQRCYFSFTEKCYKVEAKFEKINDSFDITFASAPRKYKFNIIVNPEQTEIGEISSDISVIQEVEFGKDVALSVINNQIEEYIFASWTINGKPITDEEYKALGENCAWTLKDTDAFVRQYKDSLESADDDGNIFIQANFKENKIPVSLKSGLNGRYEFKQKLDEKGIEVSNGNPRNTFLSLGKHLYIEAIPDTGYEIDKITFTTVSGEIIEASDVQKTEKNELFDCPWIVSVNGNFVEILLDTVDPVSTFEISFRAGLAYIHVQVGIKIRSENIYGSDKAGRILLADENGQIIKHTEQDSKYLDYYIDHPEEGKAFKPYIDYMFESHNWGEVYFVVETNEGFEATFVTSKNIVIEYDAAHNVYHAVGLLDESSLNVVFLAAVNDIVIQYVDNQTNEFINAGTFRTRNISATGNGTSRITVSVITGDEFKLVYNVSRAFRIVKVDGKIKMTISNDKLVVTELTDEINTLAFTNVAGKAVVSIFVEPKIYNLDFCVTSNAETGEEEVVKTYQSISYGKKFDMNSLTAEQRDKMFPNRLGYTFEGYFTIQGGKGRKYIDENKVFLINWQEIEGDSSDVIYDDATETFTIYASWLFNKSVVSLEYKPVGIDENSMGILGIVKNLGDLDPNDYRLQNSANSFIAEFVEGITIKLKAPAYKGYEFKSWAIYLDNNFVGDKNSDEYALTIGSGQYRIEALYHPRFVVSIQGAGGIAGIQQDGQLLQGASYNPASDVVLYAKANAGYELLYWQNADTGEQYTEYQFDKNTSTYTFNLGKQTQPLSLVAVFDSRNVDITLDVSKVEGYHKDIKVYVNGSLLADFSEGFTAKLGQKVVITGMPEIGYGAEFIGGKADIKYDKHTRAYTISYTVVYEDIVPVEDKLTLKLALNYTFVEFKLDFKFILNNVDDEYRATQEYKDEMLNAFKIAYIDANNVEHKIVDGDAFKVRFGKNITIKIALDTYYKILDMQFDSWAVPDNFIEKHMQGDQIIITPQDILNYFDLDRGIGFIVMIDRKIWTSDDFRSEDLQGEGTKENPYIVTNANDMAFVSYVVNNGLKNDKEVPYNECFYKLADDIDLQGCYWEPIGTKENPFKGVFDFGKNTVKNAKFYEEYTEPEVSHNGVFRYIETQQAKILYNNSTVVIVSSVIGGLVGILLIVLIIILILRKKKKDQLNEQADKN